MKLRFSIQYTTAWGERLHVVISYKTQAGKMRTYHLPMNTDDGENWSLETAVMESRQQPVISFSYYYQVENEDGVLLRREWAKVMREYPFDGSKDYLLVDEWRDVPLQNHLFSLAVETCRKANGTMRKSRAAVRSLPLFRKTVFFRISAPQLQEGEEVGLCGSHPSLGGWNAMRYLRMMHLGGYDWVLSVNVDNVMLPMEYKYVVVDCRTQEMKCWEEGDNRLLKVEGERLTTDSSGRMLRDGQVMVVHGGILRLKESPWRAAGVSVPLFALRSEHSYGVGDMGDLRRLIDWSVNVGMKVIQLLPINDTTTTHDWNDSHPYNCISAFAIHPHYLDLEELGALSDSHEMMVFHRQRQELNANADMDYLAVDKVKGDYINKAFAEQGDLTLKTDAFRAFFFTNKWWLMPYAAFCALRDHFGTARSDYWQQYAKYDEALIAKLSNEGSRLRDAIRKSYFVQFHLHRQLASVSGYARERGVALKGDIAVGVYRDSVETWVHPEFFRLDMQMGTMPSDTESRGQNWGLPSWRWEQGEALEAWWRQRFSFMEQYFDAVRLDHVLAFMRVWEIPSHCVLPVMGHFSPAFPLTQEEIEESGLEFNAVRHAMPYISDAVLDCVFGFHAAMVKEQFLEKRDGKTYALRSDFETQVNIQAYFFGCNDETSRWLCDGLLRLSSNVLFLEDSQRKGMYHPRFGIIGEPAYNMLTKEEKEAFSKLYHDYFYERHHNYWMQLGGRKLSSVLRDTHLLVCGEDLGVRPDGLRLLLDKEQVLTLETQMCEKQHMFEFSLLTATAYRSVLTISTHDMSPLRLWWEEERGRVQRYYATILQKEGKAPRQLPAYLAEDIVARHLYAPPMLCILSLQDWMSIDGNLRSSDVERERINAPYDCFNQWKYRMHVNLELLMKEDSFNNKVRTMIKLSRR